MASRALALALIYAALAHASTTTGIIYAWEDNTRFQQFFPSVNHQLVQIRDKYCSAEYAAEQSQSKTHYVPGRCERLLDCVLRHVNESQKGQFAAGTLLLGILPSVLVYLGSTTAETSLLSRRRPFLSCLIAFGSPAVNPAQLFNYEDPVENLQAREGRLLPNLIRNVNRPLAAAILMIEYAIVGSAVANVYTAVYYTGQLTICAIDCENPYSLIYWSLLTGLIHLGGVISLALRTKTIQPDVPTRSLRHRFRLIRHEFSPCITHDKLQLLKKSETLAFIFFSWLTTLMTVAHIIYGILSFSSLQFLPPVEAVKLAGRFMGSATACRMVLTFELAGMRNALNKRDGENSPQLVEEVQNSHIVKMRQNTFL